MSIKKNFVISNGLEVNNNLIFADSNSGKVGIATTTVNYTLDVNGTVGAKNLNVVGVSTFSDISVSGKISVGNSQGSPGQFLTATETGVTWSSVPSLRLVDTQIASPGDTTFSTTYTVGLLDVFINGVRLSDGEYTANDGVSITLASPCFGGETIDIIKYSINGVGSGTSGIQGLTIQSNGITVGNPLYVNSINFVGSSVTTSGLGVGVTVYPPNYSTSSGVSTNVIGGIGSLSSLYISGISTLGTVKISSGIITAVSGIVTYYGDGSKLTGISGGGGGAISACCNSNFISCNTSLPNITTGSNNIAIGQSAGYNIIGGSNNNFFGNSSGYCNRYGCYNSFLGNSAGYCNNGGSYNNFFGYCAGFNNINGDDNNFFGTCAGFYNTYGRNNNFFGNCAGYYNTTGNWNNFIGNRAGYYNTTGYRNNFIGDDAGYSNTTGRFNNFIGESAGLFNTTGFSNNFIGKGAGLCNTTGLLNNFMGSSTGFCNTTGLLNNFFGWYSGYKNTTGCCNNFLGTYSGSFNRTGSNNTFLGNYTGISTSASNKIILGRGYNYFNTFDAPNTINDIQFAVGVRTDTNPSKYWLVGNENFNIGIGTTDPQTKLQIQGALGFGPGNNIRIGDNTTGCSITSGCNNNFIGVGAGRSNTTGCYNNFFGRFAGYSNVDGCKNSFLGSGAGYNNTFGSRNSFFGAGAGNCNTTGSENNFFGEFAGFYNTTGSCNNAFGVQAGNYNLTGCYNNFFGNYTGVHTNRSYRVILGHGDQWNIAFDAPKNADKQFAVGINTTGTSEYWLVGNENFNIGIGTTNPQVKLDIIGGNRFGGVFERVSSATTYLSGSNLVLELDCQQSITYTYTIPASTNVGIVSFRNMLTQTGNPNATTVTVLFTQNSAGTGNTITGIGTNITIVGYENGAAVAGISTRAFVGSGTTVTLSTTGNDVDFVSFYVYYNGGTNTSASSYRVYATKNGNFR